MFFLPLLATIFFAMVPDNSETFKGPCIINATRDYFDHTHMLNLVNKQRREAKVSPLVPSKKLIAAAQCHSAYQARTGKMSHDGFRRSSVSLRVKRKGYFYRHVAENVATRQRSVEQVMRDWMNSPGHRANILSKKNSEFGAGMVDHYWTQNFGTQMN